LANVVAIAAGDFHTLGLRADGSVVAWGDNHYGQTSVPADLKAVSGVACGYYHDLALTPSGALHISKATVGLVIQWNGAGILQWAPTPMGPFNDVPVQGNAYTNSNMSAPAMFFRLWPGPASAR
jgi:alpha-tubulin suppressor-like RCC1 family protein